MKLGKAGNNSPDQLLGLHDLAEVGESSDCSRAHLRLSVLKELAIVRGEMLLGVLQSDPVAQLHNFVCDQVSDSPGFVDGELFDVWNQILVDFCWGEGLCEENEAVDALHADRILLILIKVAKNLEKVGFWNERNQFNHIVEDD